MQQQPNQETATLLTPRKMALQIAGWLIGVGLLAWIVYKASRRDWSPILHADPKLIVLLLGCTVASTILNGSAFWVTIQPLRPVRWLDMQGLNLVANMLNYAPIRLGAIARIMYSL